MYEYNELRKKAIAPSSTKEERLALYHWMENYAMTEWNGEYFDIDEGYRLYPVWAEDEEGELDIVDAEVR